MIRDHIHWSWFTSAEIICRSCVLHVFISPVTELSSHNINLPFPLIPVFYKLPKWRHKRHFWKKMRHLYKGTHELCLQNVITSVAFANFRYSKIQQYHKYPWQQFLELFFRMESYFLCHHLSPYRVCVISAIRLHYRRL